MKKLVCEVCGGTLMKIGEVFECQSCGCNYSLETVRGMLADGPVEVKGTVTVDKTAELAKLIKNADRTLEDKNYSEAFDLYSEALRIDPDNAHLILCRSLASAWQSTVKDCRIEEINNAAIRAIDIKYKQAGSSSEYFEFAEEAIEKVSSVVIAIANMYLNFYTRALPANAVASGIAAEVTQTMKLGVISCCSVSEGLIKKLLSVTDDFSNADAGFWLGLSNLLNASDTFARKGQISQISSNELRKELVKIRALNDPNCVDELQRLLHEAEKEVAQIKMKHGGEDVVEYDKIQAKIKALSKGENGSDREAKKEIKKLEKAASKLEAKYNKGMAKVRLAPGYKDAVVKLSDAQQELSQIMNALSEVKR